MRHKSIGKSTHCATVCPCVCVSDRPTVLPAQKRNFIHWFSLQCCFVFIICRGASKLLFLLSGYIFLSELFPCIYRYRIYHVVSSTQNGVTETSYISVTAATAGNPVVSSIAPPMVGGLTDGWIVAICLLSLVVLFLIVLLIWCIYRMCTRR